MSYIFQTDLRNVKKQFNSFRYLEGTSIRYSPKKNLPIILLADVPDSAVNKIDFHLFERYPELSTIIKKSIYLSQQFECDVIYSYFSKSVDTEISCLIVKGKLEELIIYSPEILQTKEGRKFYYKFDKNSQILELYKEYFEDLGIYKTHYSLIFKNFPEEDFISIEDLENELKSFEKPSVKSKNNDYIYAFIHLRIIARIIDTALVGVLVFLSTNYTEFKLNAIVFISLYFIMTSGFELLFKTTIGKRIFNIYVISNKSPVDFEVELTQGVKSLRFKSLRSLSLPSVFKRFIITFPLWLNPFFIPIYLMMIKSIQETKYDKWSKSIVLKKYK